jgi:hypothetical protein
MKFKVKNTKAQAFEIVQQVIKYSPNWDCMKIVVKTGNQKNSTYVNVK